MMLWNHPAPVSALRRLGRSREGSKCLRSASATTSAFIFESSSVWWISRSPSAAAVT